MQIGFDIQDEDYEDFYTGIGQINTSAADSYTGTSCKRWETVSV